MSGPMQWSQGRMIPAITASTNAVPPPNGDSFSVSPPPYALQIHAQDELTDEHPKKAAKPKAQPAVSPKNIVALAKARLRDVKKELQRMKALEKERGELERLISAAEDNKPRAVVRELKRNAG